MYNTFVSGGRSIRQGLYKVAEVIGTMIENRKYIPTYINTVGGRAELGYSVSPAEGWEAGAEWGQGRGSRNFSACSE